MNSATVVAGTLGETYRAHANRVIVDTGAKSFSRSKGGGFFSSVSGTSEAPENRSVYPSDGALITVWAAIAPSAPGLFSTTTGCPNDFDSACPTVRAA